MFRMGMWFWLFFVGLVMSLSMAFVGTLIIVGAGDPALHTVPDYYEQGLTWDEHAARVAAQEELGWTAEWSSVPAHDSVAITLVVADAEGEPINGVAHLRAFHNADPGAAVAADAPSDHAGGFTIVVPEPRIGWWRVQGIATRGDDSFAAEARLFLAPAPPAATPDERP